MSNKPVFVQITVKNLIELVDKLDAIISPVTPYRMDRVEYLTGVINHQRETALRAKQMIYNWGFGYFLPKEDTDEQ